MKLRIPLSRVLTVLLLLLVANSFCGTETKTERGERESVYRAFMNSVLGARVRYVALRTFPFTGEEVSKNAACIQGLKLTHSQPETRELTSNILSDPSIQFLTEQQQKAAFQRLDRDKDSGQQTESVVALSEIVFDESHRFALLRYVLYCGSRCNSSATMVLQKTAAGWSGKTRRPCSFGPPNAEDPLKTK